jgi:hypothetical protein
LNPASWPGFFTPAVNQAGRALADMVQALQLRRFPWYFIRPRWPLSDIG